MTPALPPDAVRLATTDADLLRCYPVMRELRPALHEAEFIARIRAQENEGYHLALLEAAGAVSTVAGFRVYGMLATGRTMYVDDLVTAAAHRSKGHGKQMLAWLAERARNEACDALTLDSGTHRQEAHAFYLRERMRITSFHFHLPLLHR